jgi:DivIVA domain-containing protein
MGEVMPLTPEDVSNKRFTPVRLREGYDMGEVDQFLDEVEAELARLTKENDDLRSKLSAAQGGGPPVETAAPREGCRAGPGRSPSRPRAGAGRGSCRPGRDDPGRDRRRGLQRRRPPARDRDPQRRRARRGAKNEADKIVGEARTKAERLESESKVKADRIESDARTRAQMLDSETAEKRTQMFGDLEKEQDKLNTEVENLRSFEREYRSRLKSYFTQQLESLETPPRALPPSRRAQAPKRLRSILGEDEG